MSERVKPERVKCQRTLPAELSSPSDAAISRLPMSRGGPSARRTPATALLEWESPVWRGGCSGRRMRF